MKTIVCSISGGRTSAYMAYKLKNNLSDLEDFMGDSVELKYVFANTGMEHDDTLRFLSDVDEQFNLGVVWVEGVAQHGERVSTKYRVVDCNTASRNTEWKNDKHPFHGHIMKYGIPNIAFPTCTREMKLNSITSYLRSIGLNKSDYYTAIGIREDEKRRVSKNADAGNIFYPLVDIWPTDKQDVLDFFSEFDWDLKIPEWQGNCVTCFKKSYKKLKAVYFETPNVFDFTDYMEKKYPRVGAEFRNEWSPDRVFFRKSMSTEKLIESFDDNDPHPYIDDGGCSESCEMYQMELI